ncbi:hypothetical protein AALC17_13745 [Oscillospiraceae bacterium 38-13]
MGWSKIHDEVFKKINQEFDAYQDSMRRMTGSQVYARAEEITAMNFCYNQLLGNFHDYQERDLVPLLQCEKPLEMLCSHWMSSQNVDLSGEFNCTLRNMDCQEEHDGPELGLSIL